MFLPLSVLILQNEPPVNTQEDLILCLDKFLLPKYPNHTTPNPGYTKTECFGLVHSLMHAGKLHIRFRPSEIDKAVDAFLEDRLWVDRETLKNLRLPPNSTPYGWMADPSFLKMTWLMAQEVWKCVRSVWTLAKVATLHRYYYTFCRERTFTVPKAPVVPKGANLVSLASKKDS